MSIRAVGFFANRNHHAALLVVALPLAAYWLAYSEGRSRGQRLVYMLVAAGLMVIFVVSLGVDPLARRRGAGGGGHRGQRDLAVVLLVGAAHRARPCWWSSC